MLHMYIFFDGLRIEFDENFVTKKSIRQFRRFYVELERDDVCRITASFVKGLARRQNQNRVHLTPKCNKYN